MSEKEIKLNDQEMANLKKLFLDSKKSALIRIAFIAIVLIMLLVLPGKYVSWITFHDSENPDQNLLQSGDVGLTLIIFIIGLALVSYFTIRTKKIFQLKKDLGEGEKLEVDVVVTGKNSDRRYDYYYMRVSGGNMKKQKIILTEDQFSQFDKGQKLIVDVYKNSMILISSTLE